MTSKEFAIWLKGFITACNDYAPTPKQWDTIKEELEKVSDEQKIGTPIGEGGWGTPNVTPIQPLNWPINPDPYNPYKITCQPGTTAPNYAVTTTPGTTGFVTIGNPSVMIHSGSGQLWQSSTSTTYNPESGSWHYTNGGNEIKD